MFVLHFLKEGDLIKDKDAPLRDREKRKKLSTQREWNPQPHKFLLQRCALYHCATTAVNFCLGLSLLLIFHLRRLGTKSLEVV